jgi:hypothetical protein
LDETTCVHAVQDADFKRCCLGGKAFDGMMRKEYFR